MVLAEESPFDHLSNLTDAQMKAFRELKSRISAEVCLKDREDDALYLRFLRARNYDVNKSEVMLRNNIEWRAKEKLDSFLPYTPPEVVKFFPFNFMGYDKEGHPVRIINYGRMDGKGLLKSCTQREALQTIISFLETDVLRMKTKSKELGKHIETWTYIFDFENTPLVQVTHKPLVEFLIHLFVLYEAHYPERLKHAFVINASAYFTLLFAIIKPLLTGSTVSKVKVFGKTGYQDELLKLVNADALPAYLGGNRTDPDGNPRCVSFLIPGGPVPKNYYFRSPERRLAFQPGVKKLLVSRMAKVEVNLSVLDSGSRISWEFETESRDIGFALLYRDDSQKQNAKVLIPKERIESHLKSETGTYYCDLPGIYTLVFDNSYSWLSQKEVFCKTEIISPTGQVINQ